MTVKQASQLRPGDVFTRLSDDPRPWPAIVSVSKVIDDPLYGPVRHVQVEGEDEPRVLHEDGEYAVEEAPQKAKKQTSKKSG